MKIFFIQLFIDSLSTLMLNAWIGPLALLPPLCQYLMVALFGLVMGSFMTVVVHRLPLMLAHAQAPFLDQALTKIHSLRITANKLKLRSLSALRNKKWRSRQHVRTAQRKDAVTGLSKKSRAYHLWWPRSHCPSCQTTLRLSDNLPLFSYIKLGGRCAACQTSIPWRYPALELLSACCACSVFWHFGASWQALTAFGFATTLLALAFIDAKTHLLPDALTLPLVWAGLLVNLEATFVPLSEAVLGVAAGYLSLWCVYWLFRLIRGIEGIGYGDFKLSAALGAWLGWNALPQIILIASISGSLFGLMVRRKDGLRHKQLPFGPFLASAALVTLFYGSFF